MQRFAIENRIKYQGYIDQQVQEAEKIKKWEHKSIPNEMNFHSYSRADARNRRETGSNPSPNVRSSTADIWNDSRRFVPVAYLSGKGKKDNPLSFLKTLQAQGLIDEESRQKLSSFTDLLLEWNQRINLTGFRSRHEIEEILIGESILASYAFLEISGKTILDFGSGAGIPGLVWALSDPTVLLTSVESTQKKVAFQKEVLRQTGIRSGNSMGSLS